MDRKRKQIEDYFSPSGSGGSTDKKNNEGGDDPTPPESDSASQNGKQHQCDDGSNDDEEEQQQQKEETQENLEEVEQSLPDNKKLKIKQQQSDKNDEKEEVTGDTIMGFPSCPDSSNRDIMLNHFDFVLWARSKTECYGKLKAFVEWLETDEAKKLEVRGKGNETFTFGQHEGLTFEQTFQDDPSYHERYMMMQSLSETEPPKVLKRYGKWIERAKPKLRAQSQPYHPHEEDGRIRFRSGRYRGKTFLQVANIDPSYHLRYLDMNKNPPSEILHYDSWFGAFSPTRLVAEQNYSMNLLAAAGFMWSILKNLRVR